MKLTSNIRNCDEIFFFERLCTRRFYIIKIKRGSFTLTMYKRDNFETTVIHLYLI